MGNLSSIDFAASVPSSSSNATSNNPDEFLDLNQKIQSTALFNDAFITSIVDKLPSFGIEDPLEESNDHGGSETKTSSEPKENPFDLALQLEDQKATLLKLMKIFAPENKSPEKVEDHPILFTDSTFLGGKAGGKPYSGFEVMRIRRTRLLIQLFKNYYIHQLMELKRRGNDVGRENEKFWKLPSVLSSQNLVNPNQTLVTNLSFGMTLTLAKAFGVENPTVLKALLDFVLQTLSTFHFDLMKINPDFEATASSLWDFATEFLQTASSHQDIKNAALSVLLAVALRTGSVSRIIKVIQHLLQENIIIDPQIYGLINTVCDILPNFNLYPPPNKGNVEKFFFSLPDVNHADNSEQQRKWLRNKSHCFSVAVQGNYLYVMDAISYTLTKIYSGENGTIPGEIIVSKPDISEIIKEFKRSRGIEIFETSPDSSVHSFGTDGFICFSAKLKSPSITLTANKRFARRASRSGKKYASAVLDIQFPTSFPNNSFEADGFRKDDYLGYAYFETKIVNLPDSQICGIGLIDLSRFELDGARMIGWDSGTYGYHCDDGLLYGNNKVNSSAWPKWREGDLIGCGIDYNGGFIFYTHNGNFLGNAFNIQTEDTPKYLVPCITMKGERIEVKINTGEEPYLYQNQQLIRGSLKSQHALSKSKSLIAIGNSDRPVSNSSITAIDTRVYLRLETLLFSHEIAIFDANSLQLIEIRNISSVGGGLADLSASGDINIAVSTNRLEKFTFDLSKDQEVLIRSAKGYSLFLAHAMVDDSIAVTELLQNYLNFSKTSFYHENISNLLKTHHGAEIKSLEIHFETVQQITKQTVSLPITSAGNDLVVLRSVFHASEKAKKAYNIIEEVNFISASDNQHDVEEAPSYKELIMKQWKQYLRRLHEGDTKLSTVIINSANASAAPSSPFPNILGSNIDWAESNRRDWQEFLTEFSRHHNEDEDGDSESDHSSSDENRSHKSKNKDVGLVIDFKIGSASSTSSIQFQQSCDWNKLIQQIEDHFTAGVDDYIVDIYDESNGGVIVASIPLQSSEKSGKLRNVEECSLLYNGYQLLLIHPEWTDSVDVPEQMINKFWSFSMMKSGSLESFSKKRFAAAYGLPVTLSYDCQANMIWAYDGINKQILKWKNSGLAPIYMSLYSRKKGFIYEYPTERLNTLRSKIGRLLPKELGSLLLLILEKLSEPYLSQIGGPSPGSSVSVSTNTNTGDSDSYHRVKLVAKCFDSSHLGEQKCFVSVQNIVLSFEDEESDDHVGYHLAVLDSSDYSVVKIRHFDNENDEFAPQRLMEFIDDLPLGSIVLVANTNCVHDSMETKHYEALMKLGIEDLEPEEDARSLLAIGRKGLEPGKADYLVGKKNEVVTLQRNLPVIYIPYQLEPSSENISTLLGLCCSLFSQLQRQTNPGDAVIVEFTAILRIFTCNVFNIIARSNSAERALLLPQAEITKLEDFILELVVSPLTSEYPLIGYAALSLFSTTFEILHPKQTDKITVLRKYADKYVNKEASKAEIALLETLLSNLSNAILFIEIQNEKLVNKYSYQSAFEMIDLCMTIIHEEQKQYFVSSFGDAPVGKSTTLQSAISVLNSICKVAIACDVDSTMYQRSSTTATPVTPSVPAPSSEPNVTLRILLSLTELSYDFLQQFVNWKSHQTVPQLPIESLQFIQQSIVGSVFPLVLMAATEIIAAGGYKLINICMELILQIISKLVDALQLVNKILSFFPKEAVDYSDVIPGRQAYSKVYESAHPYSSNMDERTNISFPGATSVTIVFDSASRTEHNCDYIQFLDKDGNCLHDELGNKLSGRDGSENFPGFSGRPPLVLAANEFVMYFHSDGSVEDWGYKITMTANYPLKLTGQNRSNWLLKLSFEIERCLSVIADELIQGPAWNEELETSYTAWMENSLVKPEYFTYQVEVKGEQDKFLNDFIDRPADSLAEKFIKLMRSEVQEDQGTVENVNKAVYATCAAILRVNGLTQEAIAYGQGLRSSVSASLLKAWKAGQKMRSYFSLGDLQASLQPSDAGNPNAASRKSGKNKKQSLYAGADEEVIDSAVKAVITRAKFLLRVPIKDVRTAENNDNNVTAIVENEDSEVPLIGTPRKVQKQIDTLSPFTIPTVDTQGNSILGPPLTVSESNTPTVAAVTGSTSTSPSKSAPSRWQLAARAVNLKRQMSNETKNVVEMWHSLVGEAVAVDKLKNVFLHRRKFAQRTRAGKEMTPTERVLQFVQSDVEIPRLHEINHLRNKRAIARAKGFDIISRILKEQSFPFGISIAMASLVSSMNKLKKKESGIMHYANGLEGCSAEQINMLGEKVCSFLKECVEIIERAKASVFENGESNTDEKIVWQNTLLAAMRAFVMDFDFSDNLAVSESGILNSLEALLKIDQSPAVIRETASAVLQILVGRFIVFDTVSSDAVAATPNLNPVFVAEPAELGKKLIFLVSGLLNHASNPLLRSTSETADGSSLPTQDALIPSAIQITSNLKINSYGASYVQENVPIPMSHSFSFSIKRAASTILDALLNQKDLRKIDLVGKAVIRGADWDYSNESKRNSDGGIGNIGIITMVAEEEGKVKVKWNESSLAEVTYQFNFDLFKPNNAGTSGVDGRKANAGEVCLADPTIAGFLFSKGSSHLSSYYEIRERLPWITHISLQILPDSTLLLIYQTSGKDSFALRSKALISGSIFSHVVITFDGSARARLFINGELDTVSDSLFPWLLKQDLKDVLEFHLSTIAGTERVYQSKAKDVGSLVAVINESDQFKESALQLEVNHSSWKEVIHSFDKCTPAIVIPDNQFTFAIISGKGTEVPEEDRKCDSYSADIYPLTIQQTQESKQLTTYLPLYLGHPPAYFTKTALSGSLLKGFEGRMNSFFLYQKALSEKEVKQLSQYYHDLEKKNSPLFPEHTVLNMFSIIKRAVDNLDGLNDSSMRRCFANSGLISIIFQFFTRGTAVVRCSAYRLAAFIFPFMDTELIDGHAVRLGMLPNTSSTPNSAAGNGVFLEYLLQQIGEFYHVFGHRLEQQERKRLNQNHAIHKPAESSEERQAIVEAQILLFKSFAREQSLWISLLQNLVESKLNLSSSVIQEFQVKSEEEMANSISSTSSTSTVSAAAIASAKDVFALLAIFGACSLSVTIGSSCIYSDPSSGMKEVVTVLGPTNAPLADKNASEEQKKKWSELFHYGDAVAIMTVPTSFSSNTAAVNTAASGTEEILVVPRHYLTPLSKDTSIFNHFTQFVQHSFEKLKLKELFRSIFALSTTDRRPQPIVLEIDTIESSVFESPHNYEDNVDLFNDISVIGAYKYEIAFDEQSRTETNTDYVRFFKDVKKQDSLGVSYSGRDGDQNWCGCEGREPLIVEGPALYMEFHSDASGNDWGYKFITKAHCKRVKVPPNLPFLPYYGLINQLKMLGSIAVNKLLHSHDAIIQFSFDLLQSVMVSALTPIPQTVISVQQDPPSAELVFESNHPYEDNLDVYIPVHVPNAKRLIIAFDPETRTENNCDYIDLFTDDSHSIKVPNSERWTGGKDGGNSNWPGIQGRPPFIMDGSSFVIYFHSDGSVNDWGWKLYVKADIGSGNDSGTQLPIVAGIRGDKLDGNEALFCYNTLFQVIYDGIGSPSPKVYDALTLFGRKAVGIDGADANAWLTDIAADGEESKEETFSLEYKESEPVPKTTRKNQCSHRIISRAEETFVVLVNDGIRVYDIPSSEEGKVLETLPVGQKLVIVEEKGKWIKVRVVADSFGSSADVSEARGWVLRRKNDEVFVDIDPVTSSNFIEEVIPLVQGTTSTSSSSNLLSPKASASNNKDASVNLHPMYSVIDPQPRQSRKGGQLNRVASNRILQQDYDFIEQAMTDYSAIATIYYSYEILDTLLSHWPSDLSISTHSHHPIPLLLLLQYLHHLLLQLSDNSLSVGQLQVATTQAKKLFDILRRESKLLSTENKGNDHVIKLKDPVSLLVRLAQQIVEEAAGGSSVISDYRIPPVRRGKVQTIESSHPYEHNLDKDWHIKFPGAKRIEIVFTEESATETTYDYVTIYDSAKEKKLYPNKIHGYKNEARRHFPGVGSVPPVVLEGVDSCLINFTTDSGTNDWGWKLYAYGIYESPAKEEVAEYEAYLQKHLTKRQESSKQPTLAVWLMKELTSNLGDLTEHNKLEFFSIHTFRLLIIFFNSPASDPYKTSLLDIFLVFIQVYSSWVQQYLGKDQLVHGSSSANAIESSLTSSSNIIAMMNGAYLDFKELESSLIRSAQERYQRDTDDGTNLLKVTPGLQANAQFVITVGNFLCLLEGALCREGYTGTISSDTATLPIQLLLSSPSESAEMNDSAWDTHIVPVSTRTRAIVGWDIKLNTIPDGKFPVIGLINVNASGPASSKRLGEFGGDTGLEIGFTHDRQLLVNGDIKLPYAKEAKSWSGGDIITVILDRVQGTLTFAVNQVFLPVAIGSAQLQPVLEMHLVNADVFLALSVPKSNLDIHSLLQVNWNTSLTGQNISKYTQFLKSVKGFSLTSVTASTSSNPSGTGPRSDWFVNLNELAILLSSINRQQVPESILQQKFVPYCAKQSSIAIHYRNDSSALQALSDFEEIYRFPQAAAINLLLQQCTLQEKDRIEGYDSAGRLILIINANNQRKKPSFDNIDKYIYDLTVKFFDRQSGKYRTRGGETSSSTSNSVGKVQTLSVGDKVVRGQNYHYGYEDGGAGSVGIVTAVQEWKGSANTGVVVRWVKTEYESLYRYNFEGRYFDVELFSSSDAEKKQKLATNGTWQYSTDYLRLKYFISENATSDREFKALIIPLFPTATCLANPTFESLKERLTKLYVPQKRSYYSEMVKHINAIARAKSMEIDELLTKKWSDMTPSVDDLIRSAALKELSELEAIRIEETVMKGSTGISVGTADTKQVGNPDNGGEERPIDPERIMVSKHPIDGYLADYALWNGIYDFDDFESAILAAKQIYPECLGITLENVPAVKYTLRKGSTVLPSPSGERSWLLSLQPREGDLLEGHLSQSSVSNPVDEGMNTGEIALSEAVSDSNEPDVAPDDSDSGSDNEDEEQSNGDEEDDEANWEDVSNEEEEEDDKGESENEDETATFVSENSSANRSRSASPNLVRDVSGLSTSQGTTKSSKIICGKCSKSLSRHPAGIWPNGWICDHPTHTGANRFRGSDPVYGCPSALRCNWGICQSCWDRLNLKDKDSQNATESAILSNTTQQKVEMKPMEAIYSLIILLNYLFKKSLPYIDLSRTKDDIVPNSLTYYLFQYRDLLLEGVKQPVFQDGLQRSEAKATGCFELQLCRIRAIKLAGMGKIDVDGKWSVFAQAFRKIHAMHPSNLRRADKLYTVKLLGERAQDAGGPYRESFDTYAQELQSKALPLFLRTVNGRQAVGYNREKWILNPSATTSIQLEMLAFLGKLMGYAIRAKEYLALNIPSIIWKLLVNDTATIEDLEGIDFSLVKSMELLRTIENTGVTAETFGSIFFETFTTNSSDDCIIELKPNGANIDVTFENRQEYYDLVIQYRLHEFDKQAQAIREGLGTIVPLSLLSLFSWQQLEEMVCGSAEVDIKLLESMTEYSACDATQPHVRMFWQALQEFTNEERSALIKFTWGRSRLPINAAGFTQRFKIQSFDRNPADSYFPVAHTCFFSLELPKYSSLEIMKEKLRYAIFNCQAIDGDDTNTGLAAAAMGWEEE